MNIKEEFPLLAELKDYDWEANEVKSAKSQAALLKEQWEKNNKEISTGKIVMPKGTYRVIYADPPWSYGQAMNPVQVTRAETYYPTMLTKDICKMELPKIAIDAVLFLWATAPCLEDAFEVIKAWKFQYKAQFIWDKVFHNMGHYNSVRHELLLIATKGSCTPDSHDLYDSVVSIPRGEHSRKPEEFRTLIASLYKGPRVELFARGQMPKGWDGYGNQVL